MTPRMEKFYMDIARRCASQSRAVRLQVGSVIVKNDNILSFGWNGTPSGWDNTCEYREYKPADYPVDGPEDLAPWPYTDILESEFQGKTVETERHYRLVTKPEVLHAEMNALMKLAKSTESGQDATLFITHAPCLHCAKAIYQAGIAKVIYGELYRSDQGILFLNKTGIKVKQHTSV